MLYHWLTTTHGYPSRDLHNLTRVGTNVLHQLRQLEAVRIRRFWGHAGAELRRAVNWVDCDCGPMTSLMGHSIAGTGLCVLPPVEEADEGLQHAYRAKMDACWRPAVPAPLMHV